MFQNIESLHKQIRSLGLNRLEDKILSLAKPSIYMARKAVDDSSIPIGSSKMGGLPDLPINFQWPYYDQKPLTFIGQFKFSEFAQYDNENILPCQGILYYFIETDDMIFGTHEQRESWKVYYVRDENESLVRTAHPIFEGIFRRIGALPSHRIDFDSAMSLPVIFFNQRYEYDIDFLETTENANSEYGPHSVEFDAYWKLVSPFKDRPAHFWLGQAQRWQGSIEEDVVVSSQQIEVQKFPDQLYRYTEKQIAHIQTEIKKLQFLFQIDTDDSLDVIWGETGTLYICIPKESLAEHRFEDCWTIMQCT